MFVVPEKSVQKCSYLDCEDSFGFDTTDVVDVVVDAFEFVFDAACATVSVAVVDVNDVFADAVELFLSLESLSFASFDSLSFDSLSFAFFDGPRRFGGGAFDAQP